MGLKLVWKGRKPFPRVRRGEYHQRTVSVGIVPLWVSLQAACSGPRDAPSPLRSSPAPGEGAAQPELVMEPAPCRGPILTSLLRRPRPPLVPSHGLNAYKLLLFFACHSAEFSDDCSVSGGFSRHGHQAPCLCNKWSRRSHGSSSQPAYNCRLWESNTPNILKCNPCP